MKEGLNLALGDEENSLVMLLPTLVHCLLDARHHSQSVMPVNTLSLNYNSMSRNYDYPHFTDEEAE